MMHRHFKQIILFTSLCLFLGSCVQPPVFKSDEHAILKTNYPIVSINDSEIEESYQLNLETGENSLVIVYNTYQHDYFCTFSWVVIAGTAYEVTDQENQYPLTLYRWHRKNSLWAIRFDPVDPLECIKKPRQTPLTNISSDVTQ